VRREVPKIYVCIGTRNVSDWPPDVTFDMHRTSVIIYVCFSIFPASVCSTILLRGKETPIQHNYTRSTSKYNVCPVHVLALFVVLRWFQHMVPDYLYCGMIWELVLSRANLFPVPPCIQAGCPFHLAQYPVGSNRRLFTQEESCRGMNLTADLQLLPKIKNTWSCTSNPTYF
jgi:hypothetical protein